MNTIRARAPLRLGLAGGGSDVSPFCDLFGGLVLNATIDRYAYATIRNINAKSVSFIATDCNKKITLALSSVTSQINDNLSLHLATYNYFIQKYNKGVPIGLELSTFCDAPIGSGLGSSSTLVVAMARALIELLNVSLSDYEVAKSAYEIERIICGFQGGRQDQYSAVFGGFNFMEFHQNDQVLVNTLRIKPWIIQELEASLVLYFSGISRESAKIISDQSVNVDKGTDNAIQAMKGIKQEALSMKSALLRGDFRSLTESMNKGWENKKKSAKSVTSKYIDELFDVAKNSGAISGKVSGAGGGGFILFFVSPNKRMDVIRSLKKFGGEVSNCHFTKNGMQAWVVDK